MRAATEYDGFELGPIRPPSEAGSLILRVTRNCPWNRCKFCSLYKGEKFSLRAVKDVIKDIDSIKHYAGMILESISKKERNGLQRIAENIPTDDQGCILALQTAINWIRGGMESVFLQDANTMIVKPDDLVEILNHLKQTFPGIRRITSYARSRTLLRIKDRDMRRIFDAGLNRIHVGMESGSDRVLKLVDKGIDKKGQVIAGQKVKRAGIELSLYYMPGLGGEGLSRENALETADAVNQIDPEYIRIRSLAIPVEIALNKEVQEGRFKPLGDRETAEELLLFIENLEGIHSSLKSDHILNLLQEVEGQLPEEKELIKEPINRFLSMSESEQLLFMVGRRAGIFSKLDDLADPYLSSDAEAVLAAHRVTTDNVDDFTAAMKRRFI
ncbi:MAG: radical SAM protein [Gammaproteobacteria bacterium]|nr:radical SAM protein [Gammaproteobacteria bacterium]